MLRDKVGVKPIKFGLANIPYDNEITSASLNPTFTAFHSEACGARGLHSGSADAI